MKPVVLRSVEDPGGDRCVDLRRYADGQFDWVECRRDPEDAHGWRPLAPARTGFADEMAAMADARASLGWLAP